MQRPGLGVQWRGRGRWSRTPAKGPLEATHQKERVGGIECLACEGGLVRDTWRMLTMPLPAWSEGECTPSRVPQGRRAGDTRVQCCRHRGR